MSDNTNSGQKTPLSSSSSNPSGTSAFSITIEQERKTDEMSEANETAPSETSQDDETKEPSSDYSDESGQSHSEFSPLQQSDDASPAETGDGDYEPEAPSFLADDHPVAAGGIMTFDETPGNDTGVPETAGSDRTSDQAEELQKPFSGSGADFSAPIAADLHRAANSNDAAPEDPGDVSTEALREAVRETIAENEARNAQAFALFDQMSQDLKTVMDETRDDTARVSSKLMEFAQENFRNNVALVRDYAEARSVPDIFNVQASYFKRQFELLNSQANQLRALTNDIASKKAEKFSQRMKRG